MELGLYNHNAEIKPYTRDVPRALIIGKPQTGKTTALLRLSLDYIHNGNNIVSVGNDTILSHIPEERQADVLLFSPERDSPFAFNVLDAVPEEKRALFVSTFLETVKGIWGYDTPTPNIDMYIRAGIATLLEVPGSTLLFFRSLLTDVAFRKQVVGKVTDPIVKAF